MEAILIIVVLWLVLQAIGGTAGTAAQQAVDNAETPAGRVAAGIGGALLLIVLGALAWAVAVGALLHPQRQEDRPALRGRRRTAVRLPQLGASVPGIPAWGRFLEHD